MCQLQNKSFHIRFNKANVSKHINEKGEQSKNYIRALSEIYNSSHYALNMHL